MGLYILFCWSCTPVCSQLVFCLHFYIWRCIPDVSLERDVFIYLLRHLVRASTVDVLNSENIGFRGFFFKVKVIWWMEVYRLWPPSHWEKDSMHKDEACGQICARRKCPGSGHFAQHCVFTFSWLHSAVVMGLHWVAVTWAQSIDMLGNATSTPVSFTCWPRGQADWCCRNMHCAWAVLLFSPNSWEAKAWHQARNES